MIAPLHMQRPLLPSVRTRRPIYANGSRARVALSGGDVCAETSLVAHDVATGIASYAVRVANNSPQALRARVRSSRGPAIVSDLAVAPFSVVESLVPMTATMLHPRERAVVEIVGSSVAFAIDAPAPLVLTRRLARSLFAWAIAAALPLTLACIAIASGMNASRSAPDTPSTSVLARGLAIHPVPKVRHAPFVPTLPLIDDLSVTPLPIRAGEKLKVSYATTARTGDIWLVDPSGRTWAHLPLARDGVALTIPQSAAGHDFRVVVHARRGSEQMQSSVGIMVLPNDAPIADDAQPAPEGPVVSVSPTNLHSGAPITVSFRGRHGEALVSLTDAGGSVIDQIDVTADQRSITLPAPDVAAATTYDVIVDRAQGVSRESLIRPITVLP